MLRPDELIYVSTAPQQTGRGGPARGEARLALVMVRGEERSPEQAAGSVCLVQDFGRPSDPSGAPGSPAPPLPDTAPPPAKRARGRPPGSRTKKPARSLPDQGNTDSGGMRRPPRVGRGQPAEYSE